MSNEIPNDGGPAFAYGDHDHGGNSGMSLRDYFAGQFLAGSAADNSPLDVSVAADQADIDVALRDHWEPVARAAYIAADAMLKARQVLP